MPKGVVATIPINKAVFLRILNKKKTCISRLTEEMENLPNGCSDKTLRRSLNRGQIREKYLMQIAEYLNVDPRILSGEKMKRVQDLNYISLSRTPFFNAERDRYLKESMDDTLRRVLSLFNISFAQFEELSFEKQYDFQRDLFTEMLNVIYRHFDVDAYGDRKMFSCYEILVELESFGEEHFYQGNCKAIGETSSEKPPEGVADNQMQQGMRMKAGENQIRLIESADGDPFAQKYADLPLTKNEK